MPSKKDPHQQLVALLSQVLTIAQSLAPARTVAKPGNAATKARGIHPHQSKYNPWRAYIWDTRLRKSVYLGAFPSVAKARAAQKAYRTGAPIRTGTKAALRVVSTNMEHAA